MKDQELHDLLEQLHQEIEQADSIDEKDRELLSHIGADIRTLLDQTQDAEEEPSPLDLSQLEESIQIFEVTHPTLTITLNKLLAILSNAGI